MARGGERGAVALIRTLTVRGRPVSALYEEGRGPALLFLHYAGGNEASLARLFARFEGRARLAPSFPGRCGSLGEPLRTIAELADFAGAVLDAAAIDRCVAIGHSLGGAVALELAIRHADRVAGLVLMATGARLRVRPDILAKMTSAEASASFPFRPDADPAAIAEADAVARSTPSRAAACDWIAADGFDRLGHLGAIEAPTLVVAGDEDSFTPRKYADWLVRNIAGAELALLPNAGHMLPVERAGDVADAIARFLDRP